MNVTSEGEPPLTLHTSAIGNPFFFTGRRMHFFETLDSGTPGEVEANRRVQFNRNRHYDPVHGRWLQRDPLGTRELVGYAVGGQPIMEVSPRDLQRQYDDGMSLYQYVSSRPFVLSDPLGLWEANVHRDWTATWLRTIGMSRIAASVVGGADDATDSGGIGPWPWPAPGDQSRHFDRNPTAIDSRLEHLGVEKMLAKFNCLPAIDSPAQAAIHLGQALHSIQDWWAHGGFTKDYPRSSWFPHLSHYDTWGMQADPADSPDGRAPQVLDRWGSEIRYTNWQIGPLRNIGTRKDTQKHGRDFLDFVRRNGGLWCRCFFLRGRIP